ncbi:MAG: glycosyltransferase family 9 protein [Desulforudis sp.]|jgi:ADP-heptose:LPS heptosyltransferase|nr:MAG: glycosyltransferase family 9 protein [Desulforudis sp.]
MPDAGRKTILIFRTGQLGDTLVAMPAIQAIRTHYPQHRLVLLTDQYGEGVGMISSWTVLEPTGWFDDVVFYSPSPTMRGKFSNLIHLVRKLKQLRIGRVFDLSPERTGRQYWRDRFFFQVLTGIPAYTSSGIFRYPARDANGILPRLEPEWKRLVKVVGEGNNTPFSLPIPDKANKEADALLEQYGLLQDNKLLAVGPGSKMPAKRWPFARFVELGKQLRKNFPLLKLMIVGGLEDTELGNSLVAAWDGQGYNAAGRLSIYGSAALMKRCSGYVGNDTGSMHLMAMVGKPCVGIFSARDYPGMWEPYGTGHVILRHETACARCMLETCTNEQMKCINEITVAQVYHAASALIEETGPPSQ